MKIDWSTWQGRVDLGSRSFICGFCGDRVGSATGYLNTNHPAYIFLCTNCGCPTLFLSGDQHPGPLLGRTIQNLPEDIETVYGEMRDCIKNSNYTGAELLGRKLIMHIAVNAGAEEGKTFIDYILFLKEKSFLPPNGEKWVEYMRKLGNEKNHEIKVGSKDRSEKIIKFVEILLIFLYEFSADIEEVEKVTS